MRYTLTDMQALAVQRGGRCLSLVYIGWKHKHCWECGEGHQWESKPDSIISKGCWCPICGAAQSHRNRRRHTIEAMQTLAETRGGRCLSETFESVVKKLTWQCAEGHQWEAKPANIQRGTWCPSCAHTSVHQRGMRRVCTKCQQEKDETEFRLRMLKNHSKPCRVSHCKECEYQARREWGEAHPDYKRERYAANPEKFREERRLWWWAHHDEAVQRQRDRRAAHPELKEYFRLQAHLWRLRHKDELPAFHRKWNTARKEYLQAYNQEYMPRYYLAHREQILQRASAYAKANPDKIRAHVHRRIARKRGASGRIETISHLEIAERDHWTCHICHKKVIKRTWSLDHLIPLSKGGTHTKENVALAHRWCNTKRGVGNKIPAQLRLLG